MDAAIRIGAIAPLRAHVMRMRLWLSMALAAGVGVLAWVDLATLALLLILPLLLGLQRGRVAAWLVMLAYFAAYNRDIPSAAAAFFPAWPSGMGVAVQLLDAALLAGAFVIAGHQSPARRIVSVGLGLALITLPPLGWFGWGNPLMVAGLLWPGLGAAGLVLAFVLLLILVALVQGPTGGVQQWRCMAVVLGMMVSMLVANAQPAAARLVADGVTGVQTTLGRTPDSGPARFAALGEIQGAAWDAVVRRPGGVVVLPEAIVGDWRLDAQVAMHELGASGSTVLIGAYLADPAGGKLNTLVLPDGTPVYTARIPMPVGNWWPGKAKADPMSRAGVVEVGGRRLAISICYEDFILWPHLWGGVLAVGREPVDALVSAANGWSIADRAAERYQQTAVTAVARLAGVPLVRAVNR